MKNRTTKKEIKKISKHNLKKIKGGTDKPSVVRGGIDHAPIGIETTGGIMRK